MRRDCQLDHPARLAVGARPTDFVCPPPTEFFALPLIDICGTGLLLNETGIGITGSTLKFIGF